MSKILIYILLSFSFNAISQNLVVKTVLSNRLSEVSGIVKQNANSYWVHNDSGDLPIIFNLDSNGIIVDSVFLDSVTHTDFEDITFDDNNNLYVGDFGNNGYNRTNLVIYKILSGQLTNDTIVPQKITFNFSDQTLFPDPEQDTDCEAMIFKNGSLYLFSKNHGSSGFCKLYELPTTAGNYTANLIDSVTISGMITGADITSSGKLVLLEMGKIHLFENYAGIDFFNGTHTQLTINFSQKEGVCFKDTNCLFITQEHHNLFPSPKLFQLKLNNLASVVKIEQTISTTIFPNPAKDVLNLDFTNIPQGTNKIKIKIFNSFGKIVSASKYEPSKSITFPLFGLARGNYFIQIKMKKLKITKPFIKQ